jgi:hypothetical protein
MAGAAGYTLRVGAVGCTLTVRAVGYTLTVGVAGHGLVKAGGVLGLRPRGARYALVARALPSRFALHTHGLGFALTTVK